MSVWFGTPDNFRKETLTFEVVGFRGAYHAILGICVAPSSWRSQITPTSR
jgi:hypothetical protein